MIGQLLAARWKLLETTAQSARATTYRGEDLSSGQPVCVEVLEGAWGEARGELARFDREARVLARLHHRTIAAVLGFGVHDGHPFIVTEVAAGRSLAELIAAGPVALDRARAIALELVGGLAYVHAHAVAHRGLEPALVWIDEGLAGFDVKLGPPRIGGLAGSARRPAPSAWLSPEQAAGRPGDQRSDLYAVGVLLLGMCLGREPTPADRSGTATWEFLRERAGDRASERQTRDALERTIRTAIAAEPSHRFASAQDLRAALERAAGAVAAPSRRVGERRREPRISTRKPASPPPSQPSIDRAGEPAAPTGGRMRWIGPALGLGAAAVVAYFLIWDASETPPRDRTVAEAPLVREAPEPRAPMPTIEPLPVDPLHAPEVVARPAPTMPPAPPPKVSAPPPVVAAAVPAAPPFEKPAAPAPPPSRKVEAPPPPAPPRAAKPVVPVATTPATGELAELNALIDARATGEARQRVLAAMARDPRAGWPHLVQAELYFHQLWRRDAVRHWELALTLDPSLGRDARLGHLLCYALGAKWEEAGVRRVLERLGDRAAPTLEACARTVRSAANREAATRELARLAGEPAEATR